MGVLGLGAMSRFLGSLALLSVVSVTKVFAPFCPGRPHTTVTDLWRESAYVMLTKRSVVMQHFRVQWNLLVRILDGNTTDGIAD
jgi:hypothetical protein